MTESKLPNEALQSQLSAFVDGELPQAETELLVRRLVRETELQHAMGRYLLMGEALRAPSSVNLPRDFSARVAAALEQDAEVTKSATQLVSGTPRRAMQWLKPVAGIAVAASVALVSLISVHSLQSSQVPSATIAQASPKVAAVDVRQAATSLGDSYIVPAVATGSSAPIPAARLTNYVVAHSEFTTPLGHRTMLTGLIAGDQGSAVTDAETGVDQ